MPAYQAKFLKLRPESVPGYIYVVQAVGTENFKIGRAINVPNRIRSLQTGSPLKIRYVYHAYVRNMNLCEMELHHKFSEQREIGEWFVLTQKDVEFCIFLMRLVQEAEPLEPSIPQKEEEEPEEFKPVIDSVVFCSEPELTALDKSLYAEIRKSREAGKSQTWIIENILKMKGRKFVEGKVKLQELLNQFESKA
jgi:hypothetical protein